MPTDIQECARSLGVGGSDWWVRSTRHAACVFESLFPVLDPFKSMAEVQSMVQTAALLVYGLSRSRDLEPEDVASEQLKAWASVHSMPHEPEYEPLMSHDEWNLAYSNWLNVRNSVVDSQREDLAGLLRAAGHELSDQPQQPIAEDPQEAVVQYYRNAICASPREFERRQATNRPSESILEIGTKEIGRALPRNSRRYS